MLGEMHLSPWKISEIIIGIAIVLETTVGVSRGEIGLPVVVANCPHAHLAGVKTGVDQDLVMDIGDAQVAEAVEHLKISQVEMAAAVATAESGATMSLAVAQVPAVEEIGRNAMSVALVIASSCAKLPPV